MAVRTDLEKLVVQLSADINSYGRALRQAQSQTEKAASTIENRFKKMGANINKSFGSISGRGLSSGLVGAAGAGLAAREVAQLADAWTLAGNKIAAASEISGRAARSLEEINDIATRTRTGITQTTDLYSKLLRATASVAKSEEEVARATETVNKAFKAGGAATSEQVAGILQLSQALGSGLLQGDELRSIRENAPLIAQAIADEFNTTIAGLKALGANGELSVDRVFKAILAGQPKIDAAFARTRGTISDGVTLVTNALTQYIGQTDKSLGASQKLVAGLTALADNFDQVADKVLVLAGIIAGALLGRSIAGMLAKVPLVIRDVLALGTAIRTVGAASGAMAGVSTGLFGLSKVAGPIGLVIGAVAGAAILLANSSESAADRTARLKEELRALGLLAPEVATGIDNIGGSLDRVAPEKVFRQLHDINAELDHIRHGDQSLFGFLGEQFGKANNLDRIINQLKLIEHFSFTEQLLGTGPTDIDQKIAAQLINISTQFNALEIDAQTFLDKLNVISQTPVSPDLTNLIATLRELAVLRGALLKAPEVIPLAGKATIFNQLQKDIDAIKTDKLKELTDAFLEMQKTLPSLESPEGIAVGLVETFQAGDIKAGELVEKLKEIRAQDISQPIKTYIDSVIVAVAELQKLINKAKESTHGKIGPVQQFAGEPSSQGRLQKRFLDDLDLENAKSEFELAVDKLTKTILEASAKEGVKISEGLARFRATLKLKADETEKAIEDFLKEQNDISQQKLRDDFQENITAAGDLKESAGKQTQSAEDLTVAAAILEKAGITVDNAALSLVDTLGVESAKKILEAAPQTPISQILPQQQIQQFPQILGPNVTAAQLIAMASATGGLTAEIEKQNDAVKELKASQDEQIASLEIERQAMLLSTFEAEKFRKEQELLNKIGGAITPKIKADIAVFSTQYAIAQTAIENFEKAQEKATQTAEEMGATHGRAFLKIQKDIDAINTGKLHDLDSALRNMQTASQGTGTGVLAGEIAKLVEGFQSGDLEGSKVVDRLKEISLQNINQPINSFIERVIVAIGEVLKLRNEQKELTRIQKFAGEPSAPGRLEKSFFDNHDLERAKTELARSIDELADKIFNDAGGAITKGAAKLQAAMDIEADETKKAVENFLKGQEELRKQNLLKEFEEGKNAANELKGSATGLRESSTELDGSATGLDSAAVQQSQSAQDLTGSAANLNTAAAALAGTADVLGRTTGQLSGSIIEITDGGTDLLALIRRAEGTAAGSRGFNETLANGAFTGGDVDLVNMTLREVLAMQRRMLEHPANKFDSSAAGGFQIVSRTLERLIAQQKLSLDQKFDQPLQTQLAKILAQERIAAGGGDMKEIIKQLRAEWQGLHKVSDEAIAAAVNASTANGKVIEANTAQAASSQEVASANKAAAGEIKTSASEQAAQVNQFVESFKQAGIKVSEAALDLANTLGVESAKKILQASPETPVSQIVPQQQVEQFPQLITPTITAEQIIALASANGGLTAELQRQNAAYEQLHATQTAANASLDLERQSLTMTTFEAAKLRREQELLNDAKQAGIVLTPQQRAGIEQLAITYAREQEAIEGIHAAQKKAAQSAQEMAEAQKRAAEEAAQMGQEFANAFSSAAKGFISDLVHGKSATEALTNAVQRLADALLDIVLNQLFKQIFAGMAGGGLGAAGGGGILAGLFHKGSISAGRGGMSRRVSPAVFAGAPRYHRGGFAGLRPGELPAILQRGEPVGPEAVNAAARRMIALGAEKFSSGQQPAPIVNVTSKIVNAIDSGSFLSEALSTPIGEKAILNFVKARPAAFRSAISAS